MVGSDEITKLRFEREKKKFIKTHQYHFFLVGALLYSSSPACYRVRDLHQNMCSFFLIGSNKKKEHKKKSPTNR